MNEEPRTRVAHDGGSNADQSAELAAKGSLTVEATWEARLKTGIELSDLVRLSHWRTIGDEPDRTLGLAFYDRALEAFKADHRGTSSTPRDRVNVAVFGVPACGVYLAPDGTFWYTIIEREIGFDWSAAHRLLLRIDDLTRSARQLWRPPLPEIRDTRVAHAAGSQEQDKTEVAENADDAADPPNKLSRNTRRRETRRDLKVLRALAEQFPHLDRAYDLCTSTFSAVNLEKLERQQRAETGETLSREPSQGFVDRVDVIAPRIDEAEADFRRAAQRYAQVRYGKGMLVGVGLLAVVCAVLGVVFVAEDVPAWYGIALLGGGMGAVVSVLQRMASRRLRLDHNAGDGMLLALGAVRPLVGAVLGMALFALLDGGWLPSVDIASENRTSFYAGLGFLAGFNERFAQDMLVGSARQLSSQAESDNSQDQTH